jgi:hypothetical protein
VYKNAVMINTHVMYNRLFLVQPIVAVGHVMKSVQFTLNVLSEVSCSKYLATAKSVDGGTRVDPGKTLHCTLGDSHPLTGYWTKASIWISTGSSSRMANPSFFDSFLHKMGHWCPTCAETVREAGSDYPETKTSTGTP